MLTTSEKCTGCCACLNICPIQCISIISDKEGFEQPHIDKEKCNKCYKCESVCPVLHERVKECIPLSDVYAAWNKDKSVLAKSSSGGMFGAFAKYIFNNGGLVVGAAYGKGLVVEHVIIENQKDLDKLHGSKYVQSKIGLVYKQVKNYLKEGRMVLFSGTPCQVDGLYHFLGNDYLNLYTCDLVCHGVPSPGVYKKYLLFEETKRGKSLKKFEMRSKKNGWSPVLQSILTFSDDSEMVFDNAYDNYYMNGFLFYLFLRKSCYTCRYSTTERASDITLADFWGIGENVPFKYETKQGVSLLMVNSAKGKYLFEQCKDLFEYERRTLEEAVSGNSMLRSHFSNNEYRDSFFNDYTCCTFEQLTKKYLKRDFSLVFKIKTIIASLIGVKNIKRIKMIIKRG